MLMGKGMALQRDLPSMMPTEAWTKAPLFGRIEEDCLLQKGQKLGYLTSGNTSDVALLRTSSNGCLQRVSK